MPFPEAMKADLRRRADMRCCICHAIGVEIHHIAPESEGGDDSEANAAPLCPACHETYGANPTKRKFIREARDNWLTVCARMAEGPTLKELVRIAAEGRVTKEELSTFKKELVSEMREILRPQLGNRPRPQPLGEVLRFFYDFRADPGKVRPRDIDFVYMFLWDGKIDSGEADKVKTDFASTFGSAMVRALIRQVLQHEAQPRLADGFTEEDMKRVVGKLFASMVMLLHHSDFGQKDLPCLELSITAEGLLWGRLAEPTASPSGGPAQPPVNSGVSGGPPSVS